MAGEKVLVIEDNPMNLELVVDLLEAAGYTVLQAATAEKGIELAKAESPGLILMDISLPGMNGLTATGIMKRDPDIKNIPVVAMTAHAMRGDEEKALAAGFTTYITKPFGTKKLSETVARHFKTKEVE